MIKPNGDETPVRINDGCPAVGAPETACTDALDNDPSGADGVVNDGCPLRGGILEFAVVATDPNVGVNDGCAQVGGEAELLCADALDNDPSGPDGVVNDGCPINGSPAEDPSCANNVDGRRRHQSQRRLSHEGRCREPDLCQRCRR